VTDRSLADLLTEGPLPVRRAAAVAAQLAASLRDRATSGAEPHRSLEPGKVRVRWDERGQPVVTVAEPDGSAQPCYLAPEQWAGGAVDARADIYAVGAILFHMIQGVPPRPARAGRASPAMTSVPEPLASVCRRALAREADLRHATMAALFEELSAAHQVLAFDRDHR
jgi:hypothetical protein